METRILIIGLMIGLAFYPTYEEWKHGSYIVIITDLNPFYPTYEEWKR